MKLLLSLILAGCAAWSGMTGDLSLTATLAEDGAVRKSGSDIPVNVTLKHPEEYEPVYWRAILSCDTLPEGFTEKTGLKPNQVKDPRWRQIYLLKGSVPQSIPGYFPIPRAKRGNKVQTWSFSTENWPEGDYMVKLQLVLQHKDAKNIPDKKLAYRYAVATIKFTLEK